MIIFLIFFFIYLIYFSYYTPLEKYPCSSKEELYKNLVNKGILEMKKSRVVIAGLARDIEDKLPYLIPKLKKLTENFYDYKIIFVENDSKDNTRNILLNYSKQDPNIFVLGCGINSSKCNLNLQRHDSFTFHKGRIGKMAYLRNIYIDFIKNNFRDYDYLLLLDYDILGSFYFDGIANSFWYLSKNPKIDALGANSINSLGRYYDPFALVEEGKSIEYDTEKEKTEHDKYIFSNYKLKRCDPLKKVRSCFAGLAIYKIKKILNKKYNFSSDKFACEHSYFNDGLNMYINPSMIMTVLLN